MKCSKKLRVLIVDDNPCIHDDFRKILGGTQCDDSLEAKEALLFNTPSVAKERAVFELVSAFQGEDAVEMVLKARDEGDPYALAFVDIRMPPGMDGVEAIEKIWPLDPDIQFIICSACSDHSATEILERLGVSDRLLMLRKPCDGAEILLLATAMCKKWQLAETMRTV
jgi:CheY-like chemotaxis protein